MNDCGSSAVGVVLAHRSGHGDLARSIAAIKRQLLPDDRLIVVIDHPANASAEHDLTENTVVVTGALVPELWSKGIELLETNRVALTSSVVLVADGWVETVRRGDLNWVAAGGTIGSALLETPVDRAVYLTRFARHSPRHSSGRDASSAEQSEPFPHSDLAADNAWYDRAALLAVADSYEDGFWEPFVHDRITLNNGLLVRDPSLTAEMMPNISLVKAMRQRLEHGRRHGRRWAEEQSTVRVLLGLASTPMVPFVMVRRARATPTAIRPTVGVTLLSFVLFGCWAIGEFLGRIMILAQHRVGSRRALSFGAETSG